MKSFYTALIGLVAGVQATTYNGKIQYFIADISTTSPCHPKYERSYTWVNTDNNDSLTRQEIENGLSDLLKDDEHPPDCVVIAVAQKIAREMGSGCTVTLEEFERLTLQSYEDLHSWYDEYEDYLHHDHDWP